MLFFETINQAALFLLVVPQGWLLALLLNLSGRAGRWKLVTDVLLLCLCGALFFLFCMLVKEEGLRMYHLLALLTGFLLYRLGPARLHKRK